MGKKANGRKNGTVNVGSLFDNGQDTISSGDVYSAQLNYYKRFIDQMEVQQFANRYIWEGVEEVFGLSSKDIENLLYYRGGLVAFNHKDEDGMVLLPFAAKGINIYGKPYVVQPVTFNGEPLVKDLQLTINKQGRPIGDEASGVLLFDMQTIFYNDVFNARADVNRILHEHMADVLVRMKNNVKNNSLDKAIFKVQDDSQKTMIGKALESVYNTEKPYAVIVGDDFSVMENEPFTLQNKLVTQELMEHLQSLNSLRCQSIGIDINNIFEKKERVISNEVTNTSAQTSLILEDGLKSRELFIERLKSAFPDNEGIQQISIKLAEPKQLSKNEENTPNNTVTEEPEDVASE